MKSKASCQPRLIRWGGVSEVEPFCDLKPLIQFQVDDYWFLWFIDWIPNQVRNDEVYPL